MWQRELDEEDEPYLKPEEEDFLTAEELKEYRSKHTLVREKLIKFATRIPAFMYLTDSARTLCRMSSPS